MLKDLAVFVTIGDKAAGAVVFLWAASAAHGGRCLDLGGDQLAQDLDAWRMRSGGTVTNDRRRVLVSGSLA
jgi:hypothetical protein